MHWRLLSRAWRDGSDAYVGVGLKLLAHDLREQAHIWGKAVIIAPQFAGYGLAGFLAANHCRKIKIAIHCSRLPQARENGNEPQINGENAKGRGNPE